LLIVLRVVSGCTDDAAPRDRDLRRLVVLGLGSALVHRRRAPTALPRAHDQCGAPTKVQYSDHGWDQHHGLAWPTTERGAAQAARGGVRRDERLDKENDTWDRRPSVADQHAAGDKPVVSPTRLPVIERAVDCRGRSRGLFDITVQAFKGL